MIFREAEKLLRQTARQFRSVAVVGPRQSGKTTLVQKVFPKKPYVSLENPDERALANTDPRAFLSRFKNGAILDEAQRTPALFSYLQEILDKNNRDGLFILTGSNNFLLQESISQTLAGRIGSWTSYPLLFRKLPAKINGLIQPMNWSGWGHILKFTTGNGIRLNGIRLTSGLM